MTITSSKPRVALVYPPYGPLNLPSLGLAILSAGVKQRGFECTTFYWNLRFANNLPVSTDSEKQALYNHLTQRMLFPWNEWVFTRQFLTGLAARDAEVRSRLAQLDVECIGNKSSIQPSRLILHLYADAGRLLAEMADEIEGFDIVGISTTFFQNGPSLALAKVIKERWPEKLTVLGGANCDGNMGQALLEHFSFIDHVFSGEVDHSFPEFVEAIYRQTPVSKIPGLISRVDGKLVVDGLRAEPIRDMNSLPIPDFDDYISDRKRFGAYQNKELCLPLESSRGCWWGAKSHCTFCGLNANGMAYRQKDAERFQAEVTVIADRYQVRYLFMADNILSTKYYRDFVNWAKTRGVGLDYFYEIKANVTRAQMQDLADAGITMVQPGIESLSSKTLSLMKKGIRGIQNVAFLKYAREYGISTAWNLLGGFPGEDPFEYERMARLLPMLSHLQPPNGMIDIEFHRFSPYHNDPQAFGIRLRPHEKYSFIYPFDEEQLNDLAYLFELEGRTPGDLSYLRPVSRAINLWKRAFRANDCTLTWRADGDDILISDRRTGFTVRNYRLQDYAAVVFAMIDYPTKLIKPEVIGECQGQSIEQSGRDCGAIVGHNQHRSNRQDDLVLGSYYLDEGVRIRSNGLQSELRTVEMVIHFDEAQFTLHPNECLASLLAVGLIMEEDEYYLSLPVNEDYRRYGKGWASLGI